MAESARFLGLSISRHVALLSAGHRATLPRTNGAWMFLNGIHDEAVGSARL